MYEFEKKIFKKIYVYSVKGGGITPQAPRREGEWKCFYLLIIKFYKMKLIDQSELEKKFGKATKTADSNELGQIGMGGEWSLNENYTTTLLKENFQQHKCYTNPATGGIFPTVAAAGGKEKAREITLNFYKGDNAKLISLSTIQRRVNGKWAEGSTGLVDSTDVKVLLDAYEGKTLTVTGVEEYDAPVYGADGKATGETRKRKQLVLTIQ